MKITRRLFVALSTAASAGHLFAQGVAPRSVKPQAKPVPSGRPFDAHFVDVATAAGLTAPVIYGNADSKDYILEATGCGCAFFDYDNDGWMDIFLLSGTKLEGAPQEATNR
jgi:enediyne biosynthesis protein E4